MNDRHAIFGLVQTVAPTADLFTLAEVKAFIKQDIDDDDPLIELAIYAAIDHAENKTHSQILAATWQLTLDRFPKMNGRWDWRRSNWPDGGYLWDAVAHGAIELPRPPLRTVISIKYFDEDGIEQTLDPSLYQVDTNTIPGRVAPAPGETWPATEDRMAAVTILYESGHADPTTIPESLRSWLKMAIATQLEYRTLITDSNFSELKFLDGLLDQHVVARL